MEQERRGPAAETARIHKASGWVHCPICTRTVVAEVWHVGKRMKAAPGQKCERCQSGLDAAAVLALREAA